jgi:hypothetical protein
MTNLRHAAYKLDPALWVLDVVGQTPAPWQQTFLRARRGASILALTARQVGKTTTAAWAIAHNMVFYPNSLSVVVCQRNARAARPSGGCAIPWWRRKPRSSPITPMVLN